MLRPQTTGGSLTHLSVTHTGQTPRVLSRDSSVGFSLHCTFYGHNTDDALFRDISKIKVMDVHPTLPWVLTVDERLRVTVWDYVRRRTVLEFNPQDIKDKQHDDYELAAAAAKLPEFSDRRAKLLSQRERPRSFSSSSLDISGVSEDDGSSRFKVGAAKSCRFYDAGALHWRCGCQPVKQAGSVSWILVVLENGVMMVDYQTNEVREVRPGALGKAKLLSAEPVSAKHLALGCSDGVVRLWDWTKGAVASTCTGGHDKAVVDIISLPPDREDTSTAIRFVSAASDASVTVWRIPCPNNAVPNNAEPATTLPPSGGSFVSMTLDSVTSELLLLTSDRRATLWGGTTTKLIPSTVTARVVSSKGARLTLALPATSHRFPHRSLLTCTNHSPVIELLVPGWASPEAKGGGGGGTCIEVVDIRTLRDGLPDKVHPLQPFNIICGTNVGLFVIHMDATATVAGVALTHPLWTPEWLAKEQVGGRSAGGSNTPVVGRVDDGPVPVVGSGADGVTGGDGASDGSGGGGDGGDGAAETKVNAPNPMPSTRSQLVLLYTDSTTLRAITVNPGTSATAVANGTTAGSSAGNGAGLGAGAGAGAGSGGGLRPGTPASGGAASSGGEEVAITVADDSYVCGIAPAMSALQAAGKGAAGGSVSAQALHQASSNRSRRSGESGKSPVITGSPLWGPAELSVSGSGRHVGVVWPAIRSYAVFRVGSRSDGEAGLSAVEVDSGNGVALAWAAPGAWGGNEFDRFAVMEPEFQPQLPPTTHKRSSKDPEPPPPPAIPPCLVLRQLQGGVAFKVLPEIPTQRPPASVFGGPLLGVVLSDKDAEGTRVRGHAGTGGGLLEMQFYTWEPHAPKPKEHKHKRSGSSKAEEGDDDASGSQRIKSAARELTAVGSRFAAPLEVSWDTTKLRVALCYAEHTHVLAVRTGTSGGGGEGRGKRGRRRGGNRASSVGLQLQYLCQVSHNQEGFATPMWHQHTLFLATQSSVVVVFPNRPSKGTSPGATVVTIASHAPPPILSASVPGTAAAALAAAEAAAAAPGDSRLGGVGDGASTGASADAASSLHPVPSCARVGGCAPLGVVLGRLVVALWAGGGIHVSSLPLNVPLVRMGMLAAAGSPTKAVEWVGALPAPLHDAAARFLATQGLVGAAVRLPHVSVVTALPLALLHGDVSYVRNLVARGADAIAAADRPASQEEPLRPLAWDDADAMAAPDPAVVPWRPPAVANRPPALHCVALFLATSRDDVDDAPALLRSLATSCLACGRPNAAAFCAAVARAAFAADGDDAGDTAAARDTGRLLLDSLVAAGRWHQAATLATALHASRTAPPGAPTVQDVVRQWNAALSAVATPGSGVRIGQ